MYPSALRATSSTHARRNRAGLRRRVAHLCATQCARQPAGASPDRAGRAAGRSRGAVHRARHRHDRRVDGDSQGRGGLRAARSGVSGRASEPHPYRCDAPAVARRCRGSRSAGRCRFADRARPQCIARWLVATRRSANDCRPATPRLCDLYLGFHWYTQGRDGRASSCSEPSSRAAIDGIRTLRSTLRRQSECQHRIRFLPEEPYLLVGGAPADRDSHRRARRWHGLDRISECRGRRRARLHPDSARFAARHRSARTATA
ncbi:hypothetical protein AWB81_08489 [Caballeronia arationis]|nr:hypothetical protein AWB81_08489 [Caballeronia arationis]